MATIPTLDYLVDYYDLEPSLFRESDNLHKLFQSIFYVCHIQQIDLLWFSENILNIDAAENAHLDFIGSIVGQPRFLTDFNTEPYFGYEGSYQSKTFGSSLDPEVGGYWNSRSYFNTASSRQLNDDEYRRLIKARVIYNQSNCTANDLLEVINLLSNSKNNTVQMLNHGLIQINTDDSSGIISYFVDRLLNEDNILPIAAGVRVGLEQSASDGSGGGDNGDHPEIINGYMGVYNANATNNKAGWEIDFSEGIEPVIAQITTNRLGETVKKCLETYAEQPQLFMNAYNERYGTDYAPVGSVQVQLLPPQTGGYEFRWYDIPEINTEDYNTSVVQQGGVGYLSIYEDNDNTKTYYGEATDFRVSFSLPTRNSSGDLRGFDVSSSITMSSVMV